MCSKKWARPSLLSGLSRWPTSTAIDAAEKLKFGSDKTKLFSIVKYNELLNNLNSLLQKEKNFKKYKIKKNLSLLEFINKKYNLIINSEKNNKFIKNYFSILVNKDYNSTAYTVIIDHKKCENKTATQIFTKFGPIAFLPISNYKTSIVFSILNKKKNFEEINIKELINQYNCNYKIKAFSKIEKFKLKYFFPRNYYFNNVLLFGESCWQLHQKQNSFMYLGSVTFVEEPFLVQIKL